MGNERLKELIHLRAHGIGPSQGFAADLRHSDVTELSFLDQFVKGLGRFLDRNLGIDSTILEQVQLLGTPEMFVDVVNTAPQALITANSINHNSEQARG